MPRTPPGRGAWQQIEKNMSLKSKIESLLFIAGKPLTTKKIAENIKAKENEVSIALKELQTEYANRQSGVQIFYTGHKWQMGTAGENTKVIENFVKEEFTGELTRPQLETLTVIAYRGPITKQELEIIRGVSCGLILRNLSIRGLTDEEYNTTRKETYYRISIDFLRYLNLNSTTALPNYEQLHQHEVIQTLLQQGQ